MDTLWTETELAEYIVASVLTVRRNRTTAPHRLPPHIKIGSLVRYDPVQVKKWLEGKTITSQDTPAPSEESSGHPVRHRGRPKKEESVRKSRNGSK